MKLQTTGSALRKKLYSLLAISSLALTGLVALSTPASAAAPATLVTFESADTTGYTLGTSVAASPRIPVMVADFNGSTSAVNSAPPAGGSVGSSKSAKVTKLHTADQWGSGTTFLSEYGSANTLVSVGHKVVTMNVYAPGAGKRVWLKIEDAAEPTHYVEKNVVTTTAGWQLLTFDFSTVSSAPWNDTFTYNEASIFFDFGTVPSTDEDWYFDDVAFNGAVSAALSSAPGSGNLDPCSAGGLCITFESGYTLGGSADFGGNASSVVTAPGGGSVGSTKSAKIIKNAGETWAGTTFLTAATSASLLTDGNKTVTVNVYSASGKSVHLKLENSVNHAYLEESATTTTTGWQTLTFTFANNSNVYNMASIFFDFGNTGAGETYYFDDVHFPAGVLAGAPDAGPATHYNIKLTSPTLVGNSFDSSARFYRGDFAGLGAQAIANGASDKAYVYYAEVGSTITLTYHVDNGEIGVTGDPVVGKTINLIVGKNYSDSIASFTTAAANPGGYPSGSHEVVLSGTTNASGNVTFVLVNTNATGSNPPVSATADSDLITGTVTKSNFYPTTGTGSGDAAAQNETIDNLWPYFYTPAGYTPPPAPAVVEDPLTYKVISGSKATISYDLSAKKITCEAPSSNSGATFASYFLFVDHKLISGKRYGTVIGTQLYRQLDVPADSATLTSASWPIATKWNAGHIAMINCVTQTGNSHGFVKSTSSTVTLARVGKYVRKGSATAGNPTDVTMRLVSPALTKDASGAPVDYVDFSSDPVKNHWDQYYGKANGGLGVFYKYFNAGSTMTLKYHVTDSKTKEAVPYFNVWLIVNKNYGSNQAATFTFTRNGVAYNVAAHGTDLGETQIAGITDENGDVTFTLVNTNSASSAEAKPSALNVEQPKSVPSVYSTITLTAHLGADETHETKDIIWAHIVKP